MPDILKNFLKKNFSSSNVLLLFYLTQHKDNEQINFIKSYKIEFFFFFNQEFIYYRANC